MRLIQRLERINSAVVDFLIDAVFPSARERTQIEAAADEAATKMKALGIGSDEIVEAFEAVWMLPASGVDVRDLESVAHLVARGHASVDELDRIGIKVRQPASAKGES